MARQSKRQPGAAPGKATTARGARRKPVKKPAIPLRERLSAVTPWLLVGSVAAVVLAGLIYLPAVLDGYPIQKVGVEGVKDVRRQQQLETALAAEVSGENYFSVPLDTLYEKAHSLSWVAEVTVRRQWPDTVKLDIEEHKPMAVWNDAVLVSDNGKPFKALKQYDLDGLPHLNGPDQRLDKVMAFYHSMSKLLADVDLRIRSMAVNARLTARLTLDNDVQLVVDRENYTRKLRRFGRLYQGVLSDDSRKVARVDLRYADGMAVTWQQSG